MRQMWTGAAVMKERGEPAFLAGAEYNRKRKSRRGSRIKGARGKECILRGRRIEGEEENRDER